MAWLKRGNASSLTDAWVILIGTSSDEESLRLVAVTGTEEEAWELLVEATEMFPDRANEVSTFPYHPVRSPDAPPDRGIGLGEKRRVFIVEEARPLDEAVFWFDVFATQDGAVEHAKSLTGELRMHEVVTNVLDGAI